PPPPPAPGPAPRPPPPRRGVAPAADLAASALNPSMDSWDQAPAASALEDLVTRALAAEVYGSDATESHGSGASGSYGSGTPGSYGSGAPGTRGSDATESYGSDAPAPCRAEPDALSTTGGTESNQLALLLARELLGPVQVLAGANAHHSLHRAAWLLGLPEPVTIPAPAGLLDPAALDEALTELPGPKLVIATAGTTDAGLIDPLDEIADLCTAHGARLHIDAAYGGGLLFSRTHRGKLRGLERAHTVTLDLHKLGWQPVAAGFLAVRDTGDLEPLGHRADYLNAEDDTEAGLPDLLGRSLRTTRRPDILKTAVTWRALGRQGLGELVDQVCALAQEFADAIETHDGFELYDRPALSTVLFRPRAATDDDLASVRRELLTEGRAVLGRARLDGRLWLKATLLNPYTSSGELAALLHLVERHLVEPVEGHTPR
ncbi:aminotransferase class V-fold PLP-dependent enzyme, partial [Streptomyces sp. N35]|uniref:pyridoxal phosphate-dependent decarboxylase family protein n=1 Tax=Streptomyces sp. N35 TaxID=2795730 RepID=UPI001F1D4828